MRCPVCGDDNGVGRQFCRGCGNALNQEGPVPPATEPVKSSATVLAKSGRPRWLVPAIVLLLLAALGIGAWKLKSRLAAAAEALAGKATVEQQLAQTQALGAAKDSLYGDLCETATLMSDVSDAVTAIQGGHAAVVLSGETPGRPLTAREMRARLMPKIDSLRRRLDASEARLASSIGRMREMASTGVALQSRLADFERTVASMKALVASQRQQLATLDSEVSTLRADNQRLQQAQATAIATQDVLRDSLLTAKEAENTVYWIAGTKGSLLELGVVVEEGKGKFLVFGKGKSVVPARDFKASDFTPANKRQTMTITLPKPGIRYKIMTRQNLSALANAIDKDGHVKGTLQIMDPTAFWAPSAYLILIED